MKKQHLAIGLALVAALGAGAWWHWGRGAAPLDKADAESVDDAVALVKSAPARQETLPITLTAFGEVGTGKPEALSFPLAGQLARLAVLPGQQLHRGDLIAALASDPNAQAAYQQAVTALGFAQRELKRNRDLLSLQLATQAQVDAADKQLKDAQATLAAQTRLGGAHDAAELRTPFDAVVTAVSVAQGDRVQAGATIAQLGRTQNLRVQLEIEPAQSTQVRVGMPVTITAVQDASRSTRAAITEVQRMVDPKTLLVNALVALPADKQDGLIAGMRVQANIELGKRSAWSVPRQAVLSDDKGAYLYQVANGKAVRVGVTKLVESGQVYGVAGALDPARPVVVLGNYELQDGMAVKEDRR
jgi:membrane fusion protein (multidrug efflux system)